MYFYRFGVYNWDSYSILSGSLAVGTSDQFGRAVALNSLGDRMIVGAPNDNKVGNSPQSGLAYILISGSNGWTEQQILSGSFAINTTDNFGYSVDMNSTGDRAIVGAYRDEQTGFPGDAGIAYVFISGSNGWFEEKAISGSLAINGGEFFASSVAMNSAGNRIVVGAYGDSSSLGATNSGLSYIFESGSNGWTENFIFSGTLAIDLNDNFGYYVAINSAGDRVAIGGYRDERSPTYANEGLVYIFNSGSTGWVQQAILSSSNNLGSIFFGISVDMNSVGDRVVIGATNDKTPTGVAGTGLAYIFSSGTNGWNQERVLCGSYALENGDQFGGAVSINSLGDCVVVGAWADEVPSNATGSGLAYIYTSGSSTGWTEFKILTGTYASSSNDNFGLSVCVNSAGDRIIVGAPNDERPGQLDTQNEGLAYIYNRVLA